MPLPVHVQFPAVPTLVVPNLTHVVAGSDFIGCTSSIVLNFVANLAPGDTRCIVKVRPVRTVPQFVRRSESPSRARFSGTLPRR